MLAGLARVARIAAKLRIAEAVASGDLRVLLAEARADVEALLVDTPTA